MLYFSSNLQTCKTMIIELGFWKIKDFKGCSKETIVAMDENASAKWLQLLWKKSSAVVIEIVVIKLVQWLHIDDCNYYDTCIAWW